MSVSTKRVTDDIINNDMFWYDDPSILWDKDRLVEFMPKLSMTFEERLNALSRLSIYVGLLLFMYHHNVVLFYIPIITLAIVFTVYKFRTDPSVSPKNILNSVGANADNVDLIEQYTNDEDGNLCQKPTKNNPFMNVLLTDYVEQPNRPPACPHEKEGVKEAMNDGFGHNLYQNVNDVWQKNNSQRQYVTNPSTTIPNDRESFQKWLYNTPYVFKDGDQFANQHIHEEPRRHGQIS